MLLVDSIMLYHCFFTINRKIFSQLFLSFTYVQKRDLVMPCQWLLLFWFLEEFLLDDQKSDIGFRMCRCNKPSLTALYIFAYNGKTNEN